MVNEMNYYISNRYPDELYHYGIKGMKWGVRKQRDLVGRRSSGSDAHYREQRRRRLKRAAIIGSAVAVTALAGYGAYKYRSLTREMGSMNSTIKSGQSFVKSLYESNFRGPNAPIESKITYLGNDFKYHTATKTANSFENLSVDKQRTFRNVGEYAKAKKRYLGHY